VKEVAMTRFPSLALALVCGAAALLGSASLQGGRAETKDEGKPLVRELQGVKAAGFGEISEIATEKELARAFAEKEQARIKEQVDFAREKVLVVTWTGSGSSHLHFSVKQDKGKVRVILSIETPNPATADHRLMGAVIALPKDATWEFGKLEKLLPPA
jgi:hypothetical protein